MVPLPPLAEQLRPSSLDDFLGQEHLTGKNSILRKAIQSDHIPSMILWGPPGVGKTTLALIISHQLDRPFFTLSAVSSGVKEVRQVIDRATENDHRAILFIDEIHRFNKAQQDAFLPYVERGDIILIGATTENPSFEVISALLSRAKVYALRALSPEELMIVLRRGLAELGLTAEDAAMEQIAVYANGDARAALNLVELAGAAAVDNVIPAGAVEDALQRKTILYDKSGEEHYNLISALHKSVRSSDPDAALYWLARMLEAGEDRMYLARRLVRMAIEDIGLADPRAVEQAIACQQTVHFLGVPEGDQALAQAALYLAIAPKSDAAYQALIRARNTVQTQFNEPVPLHLRNASTRAMKEWGYGKGYQHAHQFAGALTDMECLPESLRGTRFYEPTSRGVEQKIQERLAALRRARESS
jgi:putative ATPase